MITVAGIFSSHVDARRAVELLRSTGINEENLALLAPGAPDEEMEDAVTHTETEERGLAHHRRVTEKYQGKPNRESE
jgi:hypothetical protein